MPPRRIAVIVLAVPRHDQRLADLAGGNDVSPSASARHTTRLMHALLVLTRLEVTR